MEEIKFAGRTNSLVLKGQNVLDAIEAYKQIDGITHVELNFPEHLENLTVSQIRENLGGLQVNGLAMRFREEFKNGEFTNPQKETREKAVRLCKEAIDVCRELDAEVLTLWLAWDGYDYPFQMNYERGWSYIVEAVREVADYGPDIKISIEYKPFEPRNFSMIDSAGTTLYMTELISRPNVGLTLDFCHMLMKHDGPSFGLALAAMKNRLFGLHMNDGYSQMDSGMIFGSVNLSSALEFVYYLKKYRYDGVVFFDTFPVREEAAEEIQSNIDAFRKLSAMIDRVGVEQIDEIVSRQDGIQAQRLVLDMIK